MMQSIRESIISELIQTINNAVTQTVYRQPVWALPLEKCPAIILEIDGDQVTNSANDRSERELSVTISALWRGDPNTATQWSDADDAICKIHKALYESNNLNGKVLRIVETGGEWENEDADSGAVAIPASYQFIYRTSQKDISQAG